MTAKAQDPSTPTDVVIAAETLTAAIAQFFSSLGLDSTSAAAVAEDLVDADKSGMPSHGVMLVPMYVARIQAGSVSLHPHGTIVSDNATSIVVDAENALGQLTSRQCVELATQRAVQCGMGAVAVRNGFHFGTAGLYARRIADAGCVGIVMSNTRPLMPAPGGAEPVVGNNPLAIAVPAARGEPVVVDMALSATALGKIRLADTAGMPIPLGWAADADGQPTTDAAAAIKGMLLPAAGPKGFGLAFLVDLMCGGLSGGAMGAQVRPLYGDPAVPYRCSHFFLAISVAHFGAAAAFGAAVEEQLVHLARSKPAPGTQRVYAPGARSAAHRAAADRCHVAVGTMQALRATAAKLGIDFDALLSRTST